MSQKKFPKSALQFAAPVAVSEGKDGNRRFSGVAYSGGVIKDHGWWDAVVFDLSTLTIAKKIPVLYRHDEPIGVIDNFSVQGKISVEGELFTSFDAGAQGVAKKGDAGLPWQMSVGIFPGLIQQVSKDEFVAVNGFEFKGPGVVFRNAEVREASFVPLGADRKTSAQVFADANDYSVEVQMSEAEALAAKDTRIAALETENSTLQAKVDELTAKFEADRRARRTEDVKALFGVMGLEFSDAAAKPFVDMADEQFTAAKDAMTKLKTPKDSSLFEQKDIPNKKGAVVEFKAPQGLRVNQDQMVLHGRALALQAEKKVDYVTAVQMAEKE